MEMITQTLNIIGLIYVILPLVFLLLVILYYLAGKTISKESIDKIVEFSKWYMVSVAIVFSAKMIEAGFSERETGLKEMQVYDKYVDNILKADNIEIRWKLTEYFATVTPTERLRERWIAYKDIIKDDYTKFKALKEKESELTSKDSLSGADRNALTLVQKSIANYEKKLINNTQGRWVIVFTGDKTYETSDYERNNLIRAGIEEPKILLRNNSFRIISQAFNSREDAESYYNAFKAKIRKDVYIVNLENWCPKENFNGKYYECE